MATKILHLDASLGVTVDGSNLVSQWNDQSGLGNHVVQATPSNKPLLVTNVINGKPVVRFNRTYLDKTFSSVLSVPVTFFIVFNFTSTGVNENIFGAVGTTNNLNFQYHNGQLKINGDTGSQSGFAKTTPFGYTLISARNGSSAYIKEGFTTKINHACPLNMGSIRLGWDAWLSANWEFIGDIAEIRVYTDMTTQESFAIEQELNAKYALGYSYENVDFITLEEEQLYPTRTDEVSVDFVTLEEEQLPLQIPETFSEVLATEQDLEVTELEVILDEFVSDEVYPLEVVLIEASIDDIKRNFLCNNTVSTSSQTKQTGIYVDRGFVLVPTMPFIPNNQIPI